MNKYYFVSFASSNIKDALVRIGKQAKQFDLFDEIFLYTEKKLPFYAKKRCREIIKKTGCKRGYAYWCWKPVVINQVLSKMQDGDILVYSDAGTHMNPNGKNKLLDEYIPMAIKNDIWLVRLESALTDVNWTKIDTINFFRNLITDDMKRISFEKEINEGQLEGGTLIIKKSDYSCKIMRQWETFMSLENLHLFDDSPSKISEFKNFHENRHDQSVLSLLLKSNHYAATGTEHFWSSDSFYDIHGGWQPLIDNEPFLRVRDKPFKKKFYKDNLKPKLVRIKIKILNKVKQI